MTQITNPIVTQTDQSPPQSEKAATNEPPPKASMQSNLTCVDTPVSLLYQGNPFLYSDTPMPGPHFADIGKAGIAVIANRPATGSPGVAAAYGVRAHIVYRNSEREVYSGFGAWLRHFNYYADFVPAGTQKLILLFIDKRMPGLVFGMTNPRSRPVPSRPFSAMRRMLENSPANDAHVLDDPMLEIEVTLLDAQGTVLGNFDFKYERNDDQTFRLSRTVKPASQIG